jgi:hypothetical protein
MHYNFSKFSGPCVEGSATPFSGLLVAHGWSAVSDIDPCGLGTTAAEQILYCNPVALFMIEKGEYI